MTTGLKTYPGNGNLPNEKPLSPRSWQGRSRGRELSLWDRHQCWVVRQTVASVCGNESVRSCSGGLCARHGGGRSLPQLQCQGSSQ